MTIAQLQKILEMIAPLLVGAMKNYNGVKYVGFDYDNRTQTVWKIEFRCWGKRKEFTNTNRPFYERRPLYEEIVEWINEETKKEDVT